MEKVGTADLWKVLSKKWALPLICQFMSRKTHRFRDLLKKLNGISSRTLTGRLREFEEAGILSRKMYYEIPPKVEYSLTKKGEELSKIMGKIENLAIKWRKNRIKQFQNGGTSLNISLL